MSTANEAEGKVVQINAYGVKMEGWADWLNWTKPEWRETPWVEPKVGDHVVLGLDKSGKFIRSIDVFDKLPDAPPAEVPAEQAAKVAEFALRDASKERSIARAVALKEAVSFCAMTEGWSEMALDARVHNVLGVATDFEAWLTRE